SQSASEVAREDYCGASALAAGAHADKRPSASGGTLIGTAGNNARRGVVMRMSGLLSRQPRAAVSARASWHRHRIEAKARQRAGPRVPARGGLIATAARPPARMTPT